MARLLTPHAVSALLTPSKSANARQAAPHWRVPYPQPYPQLLPYTRHRCASSCTTLACTWRQRWAGCRQHCSQLNTHAQTHPRQPLHHRELHLRPALYAKQGTERCSVQHRSQFALCTWRLCASCHIADFANIWRQRGAQREPQA